MPEAKALEITAYAIPATSSDARESMGRDAQCRQEVRRVEIGMTVDGLDTARSRHS